TMGGALGLAILASIAASRTQTLLASDTLQSEALLGGYHLAFFTGAVFAIAAAVIAAIYIRPGHSEVSAPVH
ncbi:MFS transporter, partial [Acetobacteraceae bacterium]|nr:MFS transporter [Candidatus Parcubacteria bacterium]